MLRAGALGTLGPSPPAARRPLGSLPGAARPPPCLAQPETTGGGAGVSCDDEQEVKESETRSQPPPLPSPLSARRCDSVLRGMWHVRKSELT